MKPNRPIGRAALVVNGCRFQRAHRAIPLMIADCSFAAALGAIWQL